jgi:hypothetical protein
VHTTHLRPTWLAHPRRCDYRRDNGATLILALIFMMAVSLMMTALLNFAGNNMVASVQYQSGFNFQSAADGAAQLALQYSRYNFEANTIDASPPVSCWVTPGPSQLSTTAGFSSRTVDAWCSTLWTPLNATQQYASRTLTVYVCDQSVSASACAANPGLMVEATFDDYTAAGPADSNCQPVPPASPGSTCGQGMVITSWAFTPSPPTITSISSPTTSASCPSTHLITITGSNLANATKVLFIQNAASGVILYGTGIASSASQVLVCTPTTGTLGTTTASVAVMTPVGLGQPFGTKVTIP